MSSLLDCHGDWVAAENYVIDGKKYAHLKAKSYGRKPYYHALSFFQVRGKLKPSDCLTAD